MMRDLEIVLDCSEFTCRCPITAQPDWATIEIRYRPGPRVVETKSLKLYLETFREVGIFHEHLARRGCATTWSRCSSRRRWP